MPKTRVFVDTNAIFPCMSAGEWNRLCGYYAVETVETIVDETQRGDVGRRGYVVVDEKALRNTLSDRAAIRACCALDWGDCLVSLEHLLRNAGSPPKALASLKEFHRETWLGGVRTGFRLGLVK